MSNSKRSDGSGFYNFNTTLTSFNTGAYNARAYATNSADTRDSSLVTLSQLEAVAGRDLGEAISLALGLPVAGFVSGVSAGRPSFGFVLEKLSTEWC